MPLAAARSQEQQRPLVIVLTLPPIRKIAARIVREETMVQTGTIQHRIFKPVTKEHVLPALHLPTHALQTTGPGLAHMIRHQAAHHAQQ